MSDLEQYSNRLRLDLIFTFGNCFVARKLIINGGAIRPTGLLFNYNFQFTLIHPHPSWGSASARSGTAAGGQRGGGGSAGGQRGSAGGQREVSGMSAGGQRVVSGRSAGGQHNDKLYLFANEIDFSEKLHPQRLYWHFNLAIFMCKSYYKRTICMYCVTQVGGGGQFSTRTNYIIYFANINIIHTCI